MKKTLSKILSAITLAVVMAFMSSDCLYAFAEALENEKVTAVTGDLNDDSVVNVFDAILERRKILSGDTSTRLEAADVTGNETIDANDVEEMQDFIVHRVSGFSGTVKKAFKSVDRTVITKTLSGDTIPDTETQLTAEMAELAESLGTYEKVFDYVLNNVNIEFYYGSRKGAIGTYEQNGGSDYDQACLMIAMLKYLGYTADFAIGEIVYTENDLIKMTSASDINAAVNIFTSQGRQLSKYKTGGYSTEQAMVHLKLDDKDLYYNPSFKYYTLKKKSAEFEKVISELSEKYDLSDETLNLYDLSDEITNKYGSIDISKVLPKYEIVHQDINKTLPYNIISKEYEFYDILPDDKSDYVTLSIDGTIRLLGKYSHLYNKNITIEYELTEESAWMLKEYFGGYSIDGIDDLTYNLGSYSSIVQINAVIKLDGTPVVHGNANSLGNTEKLKIEFITARSVYKIEKELTYGALYSVVLDSQIISPHDIASNYSKLPQSASEQGKIKGSNIYGSEYFMNTLNLIGKTYFSQVDTNNAIQSELSNIHYGRCLSAVVIGYTPYIVEDFSGRRLERKGTIAIDVLGNQTVFKSRENDSAAESKIRHSAGYMSSYYESEVMEQFTGMQAVSTVEVLNLAAEQDIDILYLSKANAEKLDNCNFSNENKEKISNFINDGKYVTVPKEEITAGSWTGIGYIVYDPVTDTSAYMLNMLNGGSVCSWVGFAYLCEMITTVVECTWAFNGIMIGTTILGAGLLMTGGAAILTVAVGVGAIFAGYAWVASIGESFCESTGLMIDYVNGDEKAGEKLELKAAVHVIADATIAHFGMKASQEFAKTHLGQRIGSFFAKAFEKTSIGCDGALEILNGISPKYSNTLKSIINKYESSAATAISDIYKTEKVSGVENALNNIENNKPYQEIIKETDNYTRYLNMSGNRVHVPKQAKNTIPNSIKSKLSSSKIGDLTEAKVADYINKNTDYSVVQFGNKVNIVGGNEIGDIDVATNNCLIEAKHSMSSVDVSQFDKYTNPFHEQFLNFENKKVILYVDEPIKTTSKNLDTLEQIRKKGVTIVNSLEELLKELS